MRGCIKAMSMLMVIAAAQTVTAEEISVDSVLIRLIEEVEVPAREAGVMVKLGAREGLMVAEGDLLARIDDADARLARNRAQLELAAAQKKADNDVSLRFAKKSLEVTKAELQRSLESVQKYPKSISETEIDRLKLAVQRNTLEVEQAEHLLGIEQFALRLTESAVHQAVRDVERRRIEAPLTGMVVDVNARRGEWVEPGDKVLRIVRLDRLRAEGFLHARQLRADLTGMTVRLHVALPNGEESQFTGRVVFVSPEIDPVNQQVRVWAEIENRELRLRPGMRAEMTIDTETGRAGG